MPEDRVGRPPPPPQHFRLNLEQQKTRAKELLRDVKAGIPEALARVAAQRDDAGSPRMSAALQTTAKLADAQFTIARELRLPSWAKLKAHIESMERQRDAIGRKQPAPDAEMKTLHLRCGHDIMNTLKEAGFVGDFLPHTNPYCQGPLTNTPDYHEKRARFVYDGFERWFPERKVTLEGLIEGFRRDDEEVLEAADRYERVVLWAEHDNMDQIMLIRVFALYANERRPRTFELLGLNEFPGAFRFIGLGQLPPEALRLLWPTRRPITPGQLTFGARAWDAVRLEDPRPFSKIAAMKAAPLPHLPRAAQRHLQELPSVENGLGLTEQLVLQAVSERDSRTLNEVFQLLYVYGREPLPYMGDAGMANVIRCMERAVEPPFVRKEQEAGEREFRNLLTITDAGRQVLARKRDWHSLKPPERWVGGVRIQPGKPGWRWSETKREPVMVDPR